VATLHAEHRRDLPGRGDPFDVIGGVRELESLRVAADLLEEGVDLLERLRHRSVRWEVRRNEHGPELAADGTRFQPRQIGVQLRARSGGIELLAFVACLAERPQEVVVAVDQRRLAKEIRYRSHAPEYALSRRRPGNEEGAETRTAAPDDLAQVTRGTLVSRALPNWKMVSAPRRRVR
jgi:hypothetical protein